MIVISELEAIIKVERVFDGIEAHEEGKRMSIFYKEITYINNELLKIERKSYQSDFIYWKESLIGKQILELINIELKKI